MFCFIFFLNKKFHSACFFLFVCFFNLLFRHFFFFWRDAAIPIPVLSIGTDSGVEYSTFPHKICANATTPIPVVCAYTWQYFVKCVFVSQLNLFAKNMQRNALLSTQLLVSVGIEMQVIQLYSFGKKNKIKNNNCMHHTPVVNWTRLVSQHSSCTE